MKVIKNKSLRERDNLRERNILSREKKSKKEGHPKLRT